METQMHRSQDEVSGEGQEEQGMKVGLPTVLDDDPNAPKERPEENPPSNYQTKVTDPTGANREEAGTTPLVESFEKMTVADKTRPDKGLKGYLAEKFKPQEEDKALSEVISGTFSKKKDKSDGTEEAKATGKTTETTGQIGTAAVTAQGEAGSGKSTSVMDRLKGAAASWFRKGGKEAQTPAISNVNTEGSAAKGS